MVLSIGIERTAGPYAPPDFLSNLVALASFMRLFSLKGARAALSGAAWQEIRVRFGLDDKLEGRWALFRSDASGVNCRSLGCARDDNGEGGASI